MNSDTHILVVDDNENNRFVLIQHLRRLGFRRFSEAGEGQAALDAIRDRRPDLVLLDVIMPDIDGIQVLEALRREGRLASIPVIMVSAHDTLDIVVRCIELGAEDYLIKPIQMQMLRARVTALLEKRRLRAIEMEYLTHFDPDTRLPNRHALLERIERLIATERRFALVAITCRDHGSIALSASEDDATARLRALNDRIQASQLPTDIVARVGDGTLAWLLPDVSPGHLLLRGVESVLQADAADGTTDLPHDCAAAIALSAPADGPAGAAELLRLAMSEAMRIPPESGERVLIADPAWRTDARQALLLLREVEHALAHDELTLYFQPIVDVRDRRLVGAEALLRWHHPLRGLLTPGAFLAAVEQSPLMDTLDAWVVSCASRTLAEWSGSFPDDFQLHVNVTAHSLMSGRLIERLESLVPPPLRKHLTIELTERVHVADMPTCIGVLCQLRAWGMQVALDDFGTGFSSLSHINLLPCDLLKIDRSFVTAIVGDAKRRRLLASLVSMAHALDLGVVVEGVEREEELDALGDMGPMQLQGYLLGRPMPGEELHARMQA